MNLDEEVERRIQEQMFRVKHLRISKQIQDQKDLAHLNRGGIEELRKLKNENEELIKKIERKRFFPNLGSLLILFIITMLIGMLLTYIILYTEFKVWMVFKLVFIGYLIFLVITLLDILDCLKRHMFK
ncbi:MAG: hypothetical protein ACI93N_001029 [Flavobacteriaceae bacterium]|jgi:hypothetical protein